MLKVDKDIEELIADGQQASWEGGIWIDKYHSYIRKLTGDIRQCIETRNPVHVTCLIIDLEKLQMFMNPALKEESKWLTSVIISLKAWVNDKVSNNRILGINNDNQPS